ncbi:MAG: phage holin family protein [Rhodobacteraceae bacterium]|nr:MAG: phage holin family protein [Paracoccaceae bacterium]
MTHDPNESTTGLIGDAMTHVSALLRGEVDLARAEIDRNLRRAGTALGLLAAALVVALTALNVLTGAIVAGLTEAGMEPGWAAFAVGVVLAILAYGFARKGTNDLKLNSIAPSRTAANVRRDAQALKGTADAR